MNVVLGISSNIEPGFSQHFGIMLLKRNFDPFKSIRYFNKYLFKLAISPILY